MSTSSAGRRDRASSRTGYGPAAAFSRCRFMLIHIDLIADWNSVPFPQGHQLQLVPLISHEIEHFLNGPGNQDLALDLRHVMPPRARQRPGDRRWPQPG